MSTDEVEQIDLPPELVRQLAERAEKSNYSTVDDYVEFILRSVLSELAPLEEQESEDDIRARLESLGYIDG